MLVGQALPTAGAFKATIFQHEGALEQGTYMSIANMRDSLGLATTSRIYKWVDRSGDAWSDCKSEIGERADGVRELLAENT